MFDFFLFLIGAAVGSFLNVLIDRLPKGQSLFGRSYCDHCRRQIAGCDLIPLVSFFLLRRRCRWCGEKLSWQYPLVELLAAIVFVLTWRLLIVINANGTTRGLSLQSFFFLGIMACLIAIFVTDLKYQIIPDELLIVLGLFSLPFFINNPFNHLLAAGVLFGVFYLLHGITKGTAMGFGDVKFVLVIGLLQGMKWGLLSVYLAFLTGGILGMALVALRLKGPKSKVPFGPFLVLGIVATLFFQKELGLFVSAYFYPLH